MSTPFRDVRFEVESSPEPEPAPDAGRHARHPGPRGKRRGPPPPRAPRLDQELRKHFPEASWSSVRELVKSGKVRVDGQVQLDPGYGVTLGQTVELRLTAPRPSKARLPESALVYLDNDLVVVEKPSGVASVPFEGDDAKPSKNEPTALNELVRDTIFRSKQAAAQRGPKAPLGVVQRLDKETSGLIVFARSTRAKKHLQQQLRVHSVHRRYLALVQGDAPSGTLQSRLVQNRGDGKRGSTERSDLGREAITHVRALERFGVATLVECRLETGRTHQIRIHLAEAGHSLLGERVYAPRDVQLLPAPRVMLHAAELGFEHPNTGRQLVFQSEPPQDFQAQLAELRRLTQPKRS
ncbi:MAG: RluA family pseudouridine synthase [Myxococcales bacterium]|nr:RluA family pseudouridine synthase [Myxococcales bacterium]